MSVRNLKDNFDVDWGGNIPVMLVFWGMQQLADNRRRNFPKLLNK